LEDRLYLIFPFADFQRRCDPPKIYGATVASYFAADTAGTELVWDWGVGVEGEFNGAAMAGPFKFHRHFLCSFLLAFKLYTVYVRNTESKNRNVVRYCSDARGNLKDCQQSCHT